MKTVIEDLIEMYKKDVDKLRDKNFTVSSITTIREISTLEMVITNLESRLINEKEQIKTAYDDGWTNSNRGRFDGSEKYFNDTFTKQ